MQSSTTQPYVLEGYDLPQFVQHIIDNHTSPSWCIICSSREAFVSRLEEDLRQPIPSDDQSDLSDQDYAVGYLRRSLCSRLTMRLLASCTTMRVAFVTNIVQLRAFLASLTVAESRTEQELQSPSGQPSRSLVAVLDPILLHRPTSSFSAQGLNRTFALAIDAADVLSATLVMCETASAAHALEALGDALTADGAAEQVVPSNPWDDDIGIVDTRTKTFGPGARGWVGRTIKIRQVAERYMVFRRTGS